MITKILSRLRIIFCRHFQEWIENRIKDEYSVHILRSDYTATVSKWFRSLKADGQLTNLDTQKELVKSQKFQLCQDRSVPTTALKTKTNIH